MKYETLKTVIIMCKCIAESLGQEHAIIADESLFSQLMELKRSEDGCTFFFPMLSGLHIWLWTSWNQLDSIYSLFIASFLKIITAT